MTLTQAVAVLEELRDAIEGGFVRALDRDTCATAILEVAPTALDKAVYLLERFSKVEAGG